MKRLALILSLFSSAAYAFDPNIPPARYDRPYNGDMIITEISTEPRLRNLCEAMGATTTAAVMIACAFTKNGRCFIFSLPEKDVEAWGFSMISMIRHERAHCNGWPPDHSR